MMDLKHPAAGTELSLGTRLSDRTFVGPSGLVALAAGRVRRADAATFDSPATCAARTVARWLKQLGSA